MYAAVQAVNEKTGIRDILEETYGPEKSSSLIDYSMHSILNKTDVSNSFETKMRNELTCSSELRNDTYFSDLFENRMDEEHELLLRSGLFSAVRMVQKEYISRYSLIIKTEAKE